MADIPTRVTVKALADGESFVFDVRGALRLTVITGAGADATVSRVDSVAASAHTTGVNAFTVAENTKTTTDADWPFYRVSVAGGACRVAIV
jgi:hypothetical protein